MVETEATGVSEKTAGLAAKLEQKVGGFIGNPSTKSVRLMHIGGSAGPISESEIDETVGQVLTRAGFDINAQVSEESIRTRNLAAPGVRERERIDRQIRPIGPSLRLVRDSYFADEVRTGEVEWRIEREVTGGNRLRSLLRKLAHGRR